MGTDAPEVPTTRQNGCPLFQTHLSAPVLTPPVPARVTRLALRRPPITILAVAALFAVLATGFTFAKSADIEDLFTPSNLEETRTFDEVDARFPTGKGLFVLILDDTPESPATLRRAWALSDALTQADGISKVAGLPAVLAARLGPLDGASDTQITGALDAMRAGRPDIIDRFLADDALLLLITAEDAHSDAAIVEQVDATLAASWDGPDGTAFAAGGPFLSEAIKEAGDSDVRVLMPLALLAILIILAVVFRRVSDVAIPFVILLASLAFAFATLPWLGVPFSPLVFSVSPVILGIGVDYALHFIHAARHTPEGTTMADGLILAAEETGRPILFTAITTIAGFLTFLLSSTPQIRYWGLLISAGTLFAWLLTFTLLPALYAQFARGGARGRQPPEGGFTATILNGIITHRRATAITLIITSIVMAASASFVHIEAQAAMPVTEGSETANRLDAVETRFGGSTVAIVLLTGDPSFMMEDADELSGRLGAIPGVGFVDSVTTRARAAANGTLTQQAYDGTVQAADDIVDDNGMLITFSYETLDELRIVKAAQQEVSETSTSAKLTGRGVIQAVSREQVGANLATSTVIALAFVAIVLFALFRSLPWALLAFAPLPVIILWQIGSQSAIGLPLNPVTGIASAMVIGIGVDYSIHVSEKARRALATGVSGVDAARIALRSVGPPVMFGTLTTITAFVILSFSALEPLSQFGRVAALVVGSAFIVSLALVATVVATVARRRPDTNKSRDDPDLVPVAAATERNPRE